MKSRTFQEWIQIYEKKLGMKYKPEPHELVSWLPDKGVFTFMDPYYSQPGVLEVGLCVGDGKFWIGLMVQFMRENGLGKVQYITRRNPETWARKYGAHVRAYIMEADIDDIKV
jgi:hypothetical protein